MATRIHFVFSCIWSRESKITSVSFSWLMCWGRLWYTWDATETDIEQMRQDRSDNSLVWLLSRCCTAWKCDSNLGSKALGIRTWQTFCATAWSLSLIKEKKMQRCFESLLGPCPLRLLLLKTGLSGDYVTLHDVMAFSSKPYRCRPALLRSLLLIYFFCSQNSQCLKA